MSGNGNIINNTAAAAAATTIPFQSSSLDSRNVQMLYESTNQPIVYNTNNNGKKCLNFNIITTIALAIIIVLFIIYIVCLLLIYYDNKQSNDAKNDSGGHVDGDSNTRYRRNVINTTSNQNYNTLSFMSDSTFDTISLASPSSASSPLRVLSLQNERPQHDYKEVCMDINSIDMDDDDNNNDEHVYEEIKTTNKYNETTAPENYEIPNKFNEHRKKRLTIDINDSIPITSMTFDEKQMNEFKRARIHEIINTILNDESLTLQPIDLIESNVILKYNIKDEVTKQLIYKLFGTINAENKIEHINQRNFRLMLEKQLELEANIIDDFDNETMIITDDSGGGGGAVEKSNKLNFLKPFKSLRNLISPPPPPTSPTQKTPKLYEHDNDVSPQQHQQQYEPTIETITVDVHSNNNNNNNYDDDKKLKTLASPSSSVGFSNNIYTNLPKSASSLQQQQQQTPTAPILSLLNDSSFNENSNNDYNDNAYDTPLPPVPIALFAKTKNNDNNNNNNNSEWSVIDGDDRNNVGSNLKKSRTRRRKNLKEI